MESLTDLPSKEKLEAERVYRKVLMGTSGLEEKVEAHKSAMIQLREVEGR